MKEVKVIKIFGILGMIFGLIVGSSTGSLFLVLFLIIAGGWIGIGIPNHGKHFYGLGNFIDLGNFGCFGFLLIPLFLPLILAFNIIYYVPKINFNELKIDSRGKKAREVGDAESQYNYGISLMDSYSSLSYEEAIKWFEKAAAQGHENSQSKINECLKEIKKRDESAARVSSRPICERSECDNTYDYNDTYASPPFCSRRCRFEHENSDLR